jgi:formylglycine-generating enzyme required for sulfatase activity
VDGRRFPWGEIEHASLAKCRDSRPETTQPEPVGTFETAVSVYGMADAAGGAWDWTDSWFDERKALRVLRGGSWLGPPAYLRCSYRIGTQPSGRFTGYGFRCARGL